VCQLTVTTWPCTYMYLPTEYTLGMPTIVVEQQLRERMPKNWRKNIRYMYVRNSYRNECCVAGTVLRGLPGGYGHSVRASGCKIARLYNSCCILSVESHSVKLHHPLSGSQPKDLSQNKGSTWVEAMKGLGVEIEIDISQKSRLAYLAISDCC